MHPPPEFSISTVDLVDSPPPAQQTAEGQDKTQRVQEIWNDLGLAKSTALETPEQRQKCGTSCTDTKACLLLRPVAWEGPTGLSLVST